MTKKVFFGSYRTFRGCMIVHPLISHPYAPRLTRQDEAIPVFFIKSMITRFFLYLFFVWVIRRLP